MLGGLTSQLSCLQFFFFPLRFICLSMRGIVVVVMAVLLYHLLGHPQPHPLLLLCLAWLVPELTAAVGALLCLASLTPLLPHRWPSRFLRMISWHWFGTSSHGWCSCRLTLLCQCSWLPQVSVVGVCDWFSLLRCLCCVSLLGWVAYAYDGHVCMVYSLCMGAVWQPMVVAFVICLSFAVWALPCSIAHCGCTYHLSLSLCERSCYVAQGGRTCPLSSLCGHCLKVVAPALLAMVVCCILCRVCCDM